jgi:hypothetical protein
MRCNSARRLMLLYREGELPPARAAALTEHYASCAACARSAQLIVGEFAPLDALRRRLPVLDNPRAVTMKIMRGIEATLRPGAPFELWGRRIDRLLSLARFTIGAAAAAMVLLYMSLSYNDALTVASLERRLTDRQRDDSGTAEQLAREATNLLGSRNAGTYAESGIRPGDVGRVLEHLVRPGQQFARVTVEDFLLRKYPGLASVTLQDGLDDRERAVLADEGERFLKDLEKLIRKEKGIHER